jgi:peptidoglycan DL-endopeptidase LytF
VNRKDTILIAVLVNMALLVTLFVLAIKPSSPLEVAKVSLHQEKKHDKVQIIEDKVLDKVSLDQVDNILSKFVADEVKSQAEHVLKPSIPEVIHDNDVKEIIVKQGDSLDKIAKNHHTSVNAIMKLNRLVDSRLHIGQILYVPKDSEIFPETKAMSNPVKADGKFYIVKHGDNPWTIAIKNGIKVEELLKLNQLDENKAKKLKPGDKLRIN